MIRFFSTVKREICDTSSRALLQPFQFAAGAAASNLQLRRRDELVVVRLQLRCDFIEFRIGLSTEC